MTLLQDKQDQLDQYGKEWAEARYEKVMAERLRHVVLAKQMLKEEAAGVKAVSAQERNARASDAYLDAIVKLAGAEAREIEKSTLYQNRKLMLSVWQTDQANRRAEIMGQT